MTPLLNGNERKYLIEFIESGWISSERPFVEEFEDRFALSVNLKYAIAVSNGVAAIDNVVEALGLGSGDEVLMLTSTTPCRARFNLLERCYLLSTGSCVWFFMRMKQTICKVEFLRPLMLFFWHMALTASKCWEPAKSLKLNKALMPVKQKKPVLSQFPQRRLG
jgi:hypothetical protein